MTGLLVIHSIIIIRIPPFDDFAYFRTTGSIASHRLAVLVGWFDFVRITIVWPSRAPLTWVGLESRLRITGIVHGVCVVAAAGYQPINALLAAAACLSPRLS